MQRAVLATDQKKADPLAGVQQPKTAAKDTEEFTRTAGIWNPLIGLFRVHNLLEGWTQLGSSAGTISTSRRLKS
jgi:hypothetical protein